MKTIMDTQKGTCYVCGRSCTTQEHHIFYGTANRNLSEKYGLKVYLCLNHHTATREAVHNGNRKLDIWLRQKGQKMFERRHGTREEFVEAFGKNWLSPQEEDE